MKGVDVALEAFARVGPKHSARPELYGVHKQSDAYRERAEDHRRWEALVRRIEDEVYRPLLAR